MINMGGISLCNFFYSDEKTKENENFESEIFN